MEEGETLQREVQPGGPTGENIIKHNAVTKEKSRAANSEGRSGAATLKRIGTSRLEGLVTT